MSERPVFLMSPPRRDWTLRGRANFRSTHARAVNASKARFEWTALADAIVEAGGEVAVLPPNPIRNLTGLPFTAEAGEFFDQAGRRGFALANMAVEHRELESDWIGGFVEGLGIETHHVRPKWEAQGDCLRVTRDTVVHTFGTGKYRRTSPLAFEAVGHLVGGRRIQIHFRANPWFHGNTLLGFFHGPALPPRLGETAVRIPRLVLVCADALMPGELDRIQRFVPDAELVRITRAESLSYDTNCLQVNDTVIATNSLSRRSEEALLKLGLTVVKLDLTELCGKAGGGPLCLTNRMWGLDRDVLPEHVVWSARPRLESHTNS